MSGRLIGIARAPVVMAPLDPLDEVLVGEATGIAGDARGTKPGRQVTILFRDGWEDACRDVDAELAWITRRANLYVEGVERPRAVGGTISVGETLLRVVQETKPCELMERSYRGLRAALTPDWRGGVCCNVLRGGTIRLGDGVIVSNEAE